MSGTVKVNRPSQGTLGNEFDSPVQLREERLRGSIIPIAIPPVCRLRFQNSFGVKIDRPPSH